VPTSPRPPLPDGPFLVVGLARSGAAAALALRDLGQDVIGVDRGSSAESGRLREAGVEVHLDVTGEAFLDRARTLVKSPGVRPSAPVVAAARARGVAVVGELELAWRLLPVPFVAVTGTNGKTTTTELIAHIHRQAGRRVAVAGNIGTALSSLGGAIADDTTIVCEASSFQLESTLEFAPDAAVLLNLEADHLDWHGSLKHYHEAKRKIFARQEPGDLAVTPVGLAPDDIGGEAQRVRFGAGAGAGLDERDGTLHWHDEPLMPAADIRLPGAHNVENAMAAAAVTLARGIPAQAVTAALRDFAGVPHRLELIAEKDGVAYVNDSKATNVGSTLVALASYAGGSVHLVLGGDGKDQDFTPLRDAVARAAAAVYLIGEAAPELEAALAEAGPAPLRCGDLERAVRAAREAARPGQTVLLSPACASYDQYVNFEQRGEHFRSLVTGV
jgi:UDP-N-acetylmuramoylalanine--D-glutamate ligase